MSESSARPLREPRPVSKGCLSSHHPVWAKVGNPDVCPLLVQSWWHLFGAGEWPVLQEGSGWFCLGVPCRVSKGYLKWPHILAQGDSWEVLRKNISTISQALHLVNNTPMSGFSFVLQGTELWFKMWTPQMSPEGFCAAEVNWKMAPSQLQPVIFFSFWDYNLLEVKRETWGKTMGVTLGSHLGDALYKQEWISVKVLKTV